MLKLPTLTCPFNRNFEECTAVCHSTECVYQKIYSSFPHIVGQFVPACPLACDNAFLRFLGFFFSMVLFEPSIAMSRACNYSPNNDAVYLFLTDLHTSISRSNERVSWSCNCSRYVFTRFVLSEELVDHCLSLSQAGFCQNSTK